jgi:hypothetical protein
MAEEYGPAGETRREMLQKAVFVAPVVLTLAAVPSFASAGSGTNNQQGQQGQQGGQGQN